MNKRGVIFIILLFVLFSLSFVFSAGDNSNVYGAIDSVNSVGSFGSTNLLKDYFGYKIFLPFLILILIYVYFSLAIMSTSKKLNIDSGWRGLSWNPLAVPYLMSQMAKKHWWPSIVLPVAAFFIPSLIILFSRAYLALSIISGLISLALIVFLIIWNWRICTFRKRPGWWAIISIALIIIGVVLIFSKVILPAIILFVLGAIWLFIMWGILGWSKIKTSPEEVIEPANSTSPIQNTTM